MRQSKSYLGTSGIGVLLVLAALANGVNGEETSRSEDRREDSGRFRLPSSVAFEFAVADSPRRVSGRVVPWPFRFSTPAEQGMDAGRLATAYERAADIPFIYSMLVIRHRALVAEEYFDTPTRTTAMPVASAGKSIVGALVGIALEEGSLVDLDQRMIDFFPEYDEAGLDARKRDITIRHLLEMRAGYPYDGTEEFFDAVTSSPDWMRYIVQDFPLDKAPGAGWNYSNASTHLLSGILTKATGMSLLEQANRYIFGPMSQPVEIWPTDPQGFCWGIGFVYCTPLQLASFGQMVLDRGQWRGRRLLDGQWLASSLAGISEVTESDGIEYYEDLRYGYLWWSAEVDDRVVWLARGHGGQLVVIVPDLDLVVVATSWDFDDDYSDAPLEHEKAILRLIATDVIPAVD